MKPDGPVRVNWSAIVNFLCNNLSAMQEFNLFTTKCNYSDNSTVQYVPCYNVVLSAIWPQNVFREQTSPEHKMPGNPTVDCGHRLWLTVQHKTEPAELTKRLWKLCTMYTWTLYLFFLTLSFIIITTITLYWMHLEGLPEFRYSLNLFCVIMTNKTLFYSK